MHFVNFRLRMRILHTMNVHITQLLGFGVQPLTTSQCTTLPVGENVEFLPNKNDEMNTGKCKYNMYETTLLLSPNTYLLCHSNHRARSRIMPNKHSITIPVS